jgi:hypothetical protein
MKVGTVTKPTIVPGLIVLISCLSDFNLANFKACAEINEWDDDLKCKFLGVRMKGTALKVYHDLDAGVKTNWNNLCTTLENRFKTVQQPQFYKSSLTDFII